MAHILGTDTSSDRGKMKNEWTRWKEKLEVREKMCVCVFVHFLSSQAYLTLKKLKDVMNGSGRAS